ncbi:MAG: preprotein translocase subunit YajC [Alloprevotella sp.]
MNFISLLQAAQQGGGSMSFIIMMVALFAVMYFFMIRPQNKKQKELQNYRNSLTPGQEVVTIGGIYGTVKSIDESSRTLVLRVGTGVELKMSIDAITDNLKTQTDKK